MNDIRDLRTGLLAMYFACMVAAMVTLIAADGEANWLVKTFGLVSSFSFYGWIATYLWWLMPHKLLEYYTGDTPLVMKIFTTVFWLNIPLFVMAFSGYMMHSHPPKHMDWYNRTSLFLYQYIEYFGGIFAFGLFGMFVFGIFTGHISFARRVFIVNQHDRD